MDFNNKRFIIYNSNYSFYKKKATGQVTTKIKDYHPHRSQLKATGYKSFNGKIYTVNIGQLHVSWKYFEL